MKNNEHRQALVDTLNGALEGLDEENTQAARDMVAKWRRELAVFDMQHPETAKLENLLRQRDKLREALAKLAEGLSTRSACEYERGRVIDADIYMDFAKYARAVLAETEETI